MDTIPNNEHIILSWILLFMFEGHPGDAMLHGNHQERHLLQPRAVGRIAVSSLL